MPPFERIRSLRRHRPHQSIASCSDAAARLGRLTGPRTRDSRYVGVVIERGLANLRGNPALRENRPIVERKALGRKDRAAAR
jgi:hypothetical protein